MTASPLTSRKGCIEERLTILENALGCKTLCTKEILEQFKLHTPSAELSVFRFSNNELNFVDSLNCQNDFSSMKSMISTVSIPSQASKLLILAFIRAKHASFLRNVYTLLINMRCEPKDICSCNVDTFTSAQQNCFPSTDIYKYYRRKGSMAEYEGKPLENGTISSLNPVPHIFKYNSKVQFGGVNGNQFVQTLGQILKITEESGALAGLYAFLVCIGNNRKSFITKSNHLAHSFLRKNDNELNNQQGYTTGSSSSTTNPSTGNGGKKSGGRRPVLFDLPSTAGIMDYERIDTLVNELKSSPFPLIDLFHDDYVYCVTLFDYFVALSSCLGTGVCLYGLKRFVSLQNRTDVSSFSCRIASYTVNEKEIHGPLILSFTNAIVYILFRAIIDGESLVNYNSEGTLSLVQKCWNHYVVVDDDAFQLPINTFELREKECYNAIISASWCLICEVSVDDLKEWSNLEDDCLATKIDRLLLQSNVPVSAISSSDFNNDLVGCYQSLRNFPPISIKVKALVKVCLLLSGVTDGSGATCEAVEDVTCVDSINTANTSRDSLEKVSTFNSTPLPPCGSSFSKKEDQTLNDPKDECRQNASKKNSDEDVAQIVFCKMRLNAVALHFVVMMIIDNLYHTKSSVGPTEEELNRMEIQLLLKDMVGKFSDFDESEEEKQFLEIKDAVAASAAASASALSGPFSCEERNAIKTPNFRSVHIVGNMKQKSQLEILRLFKCGDYNIVFATDVMEEGLDVRVCKFVINYDLPCTLKSFVQRKGRSRVKDSQLISLIPYGEDGNESLEELIRLSVQEKAVEQCTNDPKQSDSFVGLEIFEASTTLTSNDSTFMTSFMEVEGLNCDILSDFLVSSVSRSVDSSFSSISTTSCDKYVVASTGAEADSKSSTQILQRFCQQLPHDSFYSPRAIYWVTSSKSPTTKQPSYIASILLPPHVEPKLRFVVGPPASSKALAKGYASLECVKLPHKYGELNDFLMIISSKSSAKVLVRKPKVVVQSAEVQARKKRKMSERIGENEVHLETTEEDHEIIDDSFVVADEDFAINNENKDLMKISSKIVPDCLISYPTINEEEFSVELYLYIFQGTFSDPKSYEITRSCLSCINYYQGLNGFGIALNTLVPEDILIDSFRGYIRESEGVDVVISFLEKRKVSLIELIHMQRFHKGVVAWEPENSELKNPDGSLQWIDKDTLESSLWPSCQEVAYPIPLEEWSLSSNGAFYIIFPIPELLFPSDYSCDLSELGNHKAVQYVEMLKTCSIFSDPDEWLSFLITGANEAQMLVHNFFVQDFINKNLKASFVVKYNPSVEAESLLGYLISRGHGGIHACCEQDVSEFRGTATTETSQVEFSSSVFSTVDSDPVGTVISPLKRLKDVAKHVTPTTYHAEVKFVATQTVNHIVNAVEAYSEDPTTTNLKSCIDVVYDFQKQYVNRCEENEPLSAYLQQINFVKPQVAPLLAAKKPVEQAIIPVTYLQIHLKRYPMYKKEILALANNSDHYLIKAVSMIGKLTLHPLLTKTANRYVKPQNFKTNYLTGNVVSCIGIKERRRKYHCHASVQYLIPQFCQVLGKCKWYAVGLVVPSLVWRLEALLLAVEARKTLLKAIVNYDNRLLSIKKKGLLSEQEQNKNGGIFDQICHPEMMIKTSRNGEISIDQLPFTFPNASLMLEALSPRLVGEMIDSERLEVLGDSLLKLVTTVEVFRIFPTKHEGFLSFERSKFISNLFLLERCCKLRLHHYVRAIQISNGKQQLIIRPSGLSFSAIKNGSSVWNHCITPSGNSTSEIEKPPVDTNEGTDVNNDELENVDLSFDDVGSFYNNIFPVKQHGYAEVRPKVLADAMESIIGAFLIAGGITAGIAIIKAIGAWPTFEAASCCSSSAVSSLLSPSAPVVVSSSDNVLLSSANCSSKAKPKAMKVEKKLEMKSLDLEESEVDTEEEIVELMEATEETETGVDETQEKSKTVVDSFNLAFQLEYNAKDEVLQFPDNYPEPLKKIVLGLKDNMLELQRFQEEDSLFESTIESSFNERVFPHALVDEKLISFNKCIKPSSSQESETIASTNTSPDSSFTSSPASVSPSPVSTSVTAWTPSGTTAAARSGTGFGMMKLFPEQIIEELYTIFNYRFKNWKILEEALIHCSCQEKSSNQRFEFLGDAVLDFAVVTLLYQYQPFATPGDLSSQKSSITCNRNLGLIGIRMLLFKYLKFFSVKLENEFYELFEMLNEEKRQHALQQLLEKTEEESTTSSFSLMTALPDLNEQEMKIEDLMKVCLSEMITIVEEKSVNNRSASLASPQPGHSYTGNENNRNSVAGKRKKNAVRISNSTSKAVADLFEALFGAMFLDCNCSVEEIIKIVQFINIIPQFSSISSSETDLFDSEIDIQIIGEEEEGAVKPVMAHPVKLMSTTDNPDLVATINDAEPPIATQPNSSVPSGNLFSLLKKRKNDDDFNQSCSSDKKTKTD
jgi:dsRNA-specific ribonuclease